MKHRVLKFFLSLSLKKTTIGIGNLENTSTLSISHTEPNKITLYLPLNLPTIRQGDSLFIQATTL